MKKIKLFSLLAAILFVGSTLAAEPTYAIIPKSEVILTTSYNELKKHYTDTTWVANGFTNGNSSKSATIEPLVDGDTVLAKATNKTGIKLKDTPTTKQITLYVTGIVEVYAYMCGGNKRWVYMNVTAGGKTEQVKDSLDGTNTKILSKTNLDPNTQYTLNFSASNDACFYAIKFITPQLPILKSLTINEVAATIDDEAKTITAVLPYGTTIDWESVEVVLGGNATKWEMDAAHTTLTISNEDGSQKVTYTLNITVDTTVSHDATLSDITLDGKILADFATETRTYTVELAYSAAVPAIEATPTNAAAKIAVDAPTLAKGETGEATITVTAQDNTTVEVYTINFTRAAAEAAKLYQVIFSNNAKGAIDATKKTVTVPYLADTEDAELPTTEEKNITVKGTGATVALNEKNEIVITSEDDKETAFTIVGAPLVPKELGNDTVTFDGNEAYFFAPGGFNKDKSYGWVASKNAEEDSNPRITAGKCRMYIALPACDSVTLFIGTTNDRKAELYVNGVDNGEVTFPKSSKYVIKKGLSNTAANFIGIENHGSGDLGFKRILLSGAKDISTAFDQAQVEVKAVKVIRDGQLLIIRDGKTYTAQGVQVQ